MPVTGDPKELRAVAAAAKRAAADITSSYHLLESKHRSTRYMVPNKANVDDLFRRTQAQIRSSVESLNEIEKRMLAIAIALEQVNK
ncbi:hypothetical protein SAMN05444374_11852 [Rhodococcoides kroppenstedtii]|uniref:Uncharacterized protein n=1 Tax=Rhodococcoides kroppenstedtii TaxID=293050 RepID=A0A1I0UCV5_9NOCA|nr:hypothetical protein [Rhodococcus kroppenstedtii]SFA61627.1 hypothetical protein SAMN05444374_11852 [Rhodococcus kroppenstedtii]